MATYNGGEVVAHVGADISDYQSAMKSLSSSTSSAVSSASQAISSIGKTLAVTGAAITALGVKSVSSFGDFQASLNKAAVIAGGTSKDIQGLSDVANHMGAVLPISAQDAADAMVAMARDGATIGTIKKEFPAIAQAATAAGADLQSTASVVQQSMNIWGDSLKSPQRAAAILTQTANLSNASIEDMQQALATIGGTASNAGIDMNTTATAIGLLTNKGFSAAQASQDLNHALLLMQAPSDKAAKQAAALGLNFNDAQGNMKPLPTILNEISDSMDGMTSSEKAAALKTMFGTSGMAAILPLMKSVKDTTGSATTSWSAFTDQMDKASSSTATATKFLNEQANEMQQNLGSKLEQVGGNWEALRNAAMAGSSGVISSLVDMASGALEWATTSNSAVGSGIRTFLGLSPIIGAATLATGSFLTAATKIGGVMRTVGTAVGSLFVTPIGLAVLAIGLLTGALSIAYKYSKPFRDAIKNIGEVFTKVFNPATKKSGDEIKKFGTSVNSVMKKVGEAFGDKLAKVINNVNWGKVFTKINTILQSVLKVATQTVQVFGMLAEKAINSGAAIIVWNTVATTLGVVYNVVKTLYVKFKELYDIVGKIGGQGSNTGRTLQSAFAVTGVIGAIAILTRIPRILSLILSPAKLLSSTFGSLIGHIIPFGSGAEKAASSASKATKPFGGLAIKALEVGAGIGIAAAGLGTLAFGISSLASQGDQGTNTLKSFGIAVGMLTAEFALLGGSLTRGAVGIGVMLGGLTVLALALTELSKTGQQGQNTMMTFGLTISGVALVFALLGPLLTSGAVGIAVFGGAILAAGIGIGLATSGLALLIQTLNDVNISANSITGTMVALGIGFAAMVTGFLMSIMKQAPIIVLQFVTMIINILLVISSQLPAFIQAGVTLIVNFLQGIITAIPQIAPVIVNLIVTIVSTIVDNLPVLIQQGINLILALISGVVTAVPQIVPPLINMLAVIMDTISQNLPQIIQSGANLLISFINGIISIIPRVIPVIIDLIITIINTVAGKLGDIINAGVNLLIKFIQGVSQTIPRIVDTVVDLIVTFIGAIGNNLPRIINAGIDLLAKFIMGIVNNIPKLTSVAIQAVERFVYGVGNALGQILSSGSRLLLIFIQGIISGFGGASSAGSGAANAVSNGIGNISLFGAGQAIMSGFLSGLRSMWGGITSFVGSIAGWIRDHKGPISYDRKLLIPAGAAIMGGFGNSLNTNFADVKKSVSSYAGQIADEFGQQKYVASAQLTASSTGVAGHINGGLDSLSKEVAEQSAQQPIYEVHNEIIGDKITTTVNSKNARRQAMSQFIPGGA